MSKTLSYEKNHELIHLDLKFAEKFWLIIKHLLNFSNVTTHLTINKIFLFSKTAFISLI